VRVGNFAAQPNPPNSAAPAKIVGLVLGKMTVELGGVRTRKYYGKQFGPSNFESKMQLSML
jgi:hypothetical protein